MYTAAPFLHTDFLILQYEKHNSHYSFNYKESTNLSIIEYHTIILQKKT